MKKWLSCLLVLFLLAGSFALAESPAAPQKNLIILYTSDVHCAIAKGWGYAGVKAMKTALEQEYDVLLVDDGDHYQGEAAGTLTSGEAILTVMNSMGYDVAIPGNHDFDYGVDHLLELVSKANFPYICCNFFRDGIQVFPSYLVKEIGGRKIGFVGVTTPETLRAANPKYFWNDKGEFNCDFLGDETGEKLYAAVQKAVDDVTAEGVDYVILLAHLGNEDECKPFTYADVISHTTGITAVLDGHSHDTEQVTMKNKDGKDVVRTACGTKLAFVGALTITTDGKVSSELYPWGASLPAPELLGLKNVTENTVEAVTQEISKVTSKVIGKTSVDLTIMDPKAKDENGAPIRIVRRAETNMADLVADAYLSQSGGADIVIINGGGVRASIKAGDITMGDLLAVQPFSNSLSVIQITGQQILDMLEWGVHSMPNEFPGFPQVSGMTYEVDPSIPSPCVQDNNGMFDHVDDKAERRIRNVLIGGAPLDSEKTYKLCGIDYMLLSFGDGYAMLKDCPILIKDVVVDNQAVINYMTSLPDGALTEKYGNPYGDGRIVSVAPAQ